MPFSPVFSLIGMSPYPHNGVHLDQFVKYADYRMFVDKNIKMSI